MELFLIYLWLRLDAVITVFTCVTTFSFVASALVYMVSEREAMLWVKRWAIIGAVVGGVLVFLPTSKDVAVLVGANYGLAVAKSPEGQKVWTIMRGKANELLDEEISKLKETK